MINAGVSSDDHVHDLAESFNAAPCLLLGGDRDLDVSRGESKLITRPLCKLQRNVLRFVLLSSNVTSILMS